MKRAGSILANPDATEDERCWALDIANAWRAAHKEVLSEMEGVLEGIARDLGGQLSKGALVVSRLKRIDTIEGKLRRPGLSIKLNEMNDIAGCRVILSELAEVRAFAKVVASCTAVKERNGIKDYIALPKHDGYRSLHIITKHEAPHAGFSGLFCETQIRTRLQHAWATALETYDVVTGVGMKFGRGGPDERRFFSLVSALFALKEGAAPVLEMSSSAAAMRDELRMLERRCPIVEMLRACSGSVTILSREDFSYAAYFVLEIDYDLQCTRIYGYPEESANDAERVYFERERLKGPLQDVLLVRSVSIKGLLEAYPNYSMDIRLFLECVDDFLM
ncbi:RelA/SpoT domain-containing protein [Olsenella uli]|uniref:RelA/SpoT domain-containing protein n=1 Tax=Olsenella uli TaxID=133926 RepID=UPI00195EE5D1|nr:RelA/SpoT domain-containing protein [Olsenella uli]